MSTLVVTLHPSQDNNMGYTLYIVHLSICYINLLTFLEIHFRITGFDDSWCKLEKWFNKFGILTKVNVDKPAGRLLLRLSFFCCKICGNCNRHGVIISGIYI